MITVVAACGGNAGSTESSGGTTPAAVIDEAKSNVAAAQKEITTVSEPSVSVKTEPGKTIGVVPITLTSSALVQIIDGIKAAAKVLDWKVEVVDGKFSSKGYSDADRQLAQKGVDGVIHAVIADEATPASMKFLKGEGIPVVCTLCGPLEPPIDAPSVGNIDVGGVKMGNLLADWVIADSNGKGKIAIFDNASVPSVHAYYTGFMERIKDCTGCEIVVDEKVNPSADIIKSGRESMAAALQQHPKGTLDYVITPSDDEATGPAQAIKAAGRDEIQIGSHGCTDQAQAMVRAGGPQTACVGIPLEWSGWAAVDSLARAFAGEPGAYAPPVSLFTKENLQPEGEPLFHNAAYAEQYAKVWGR